MLYSVTLRANRLLCGDFGMPPEPMKISPGEVFVADSDTAKDLESRGLVERVLPAGSMPYTSSDAYLAQFVATLRQRMYTPPENKMMDVPENKCARCNCASETELCEKCKADLFPVNAVPMKRKRGRPKGSKNKPKPTGDIAA